MKKFNKALIFKYWKQTGYFPIRILLFNGKSLVSKLIKKWTRGQFSHVGFNLIPSLTEYYYGLNVEAWTNTSQKNGLSSLLGIFGARWQLTDFTCHTPSTPYLVLEKTVSKKVFIKYLDLMELISLMNIPYDWKEILGFVFKTSEPIPNGKFVCSTGTVFFLQYLGLIDKSIPYWRQSPQDVYEILISSGFIEKGWQYTL